MPKTVFMHPILSVAVVVATAVMLRWLLLQQGYVVKASSRTLPRRIHLALPSGPGFVALWRGASLHKETCPFEHATCNTIMVCGSAWTQQRQRPSNRPNCIRVVSLPLMREGLLIFLADLWLMTSQLESLEH